MSPRKKYELSKVTVEPDGQRPSTWTFAGEAMRGTEYSYRVTDGNFASRNSWEFIVRVPAGRGARVEVRPRTSPPVKAWAELPDRSLTFSRATLGAARGKWYCQVAFADATGQKSKSVVRTDQRDQLPKWFDSLTGRMRRKAAVKPTKGTDGNALVILIAAGDHEAMIRLFFATKVWVLKERVVIGDA